MRRTPPAQATRKPAWPGNARTRNRAWPFMGHALMENRNGLFVGIRATQATGKAEAEAAQELVAEQIRQGAQPDSVGADKGYCATSFVKALRERSIGRTWPRSKAAGSKASMAARWAAPPIRSLSASANESRKVQLAARDRRHQEDEGAWAAEG